MVSSVPVHPTDTAGSSLRSLRVFVRDHKRREVPFGDRTLEAAYDQFVFSQARKGIEEARRPAVTTSYGQVATDARIGGCPARVYELGPEPAVGDVGGRRPAVVTWQDGDMFDLLSSDVLEPSVLATIAHSIYREWAVDTLPTDRLLTTRGMRASAPSARRPGTKTPSGTPACSTRRR